MRFMMIVKADERTEAGVVTDGPFVETNELIAGFWIIDVKSRDEAIAWASKVPFKQLPNQGRPAEIELRPLFEEEDFAQIV